MARNIIGSPHDDSNLNFLNDNFKQLFDDLGTATGTKNKLDNFLNGSGVVSRGMIANGSISAAKIEDGVIGTAKFSDRAVNRSKLADSFMYNERVNSEVNMSTLIKTGTYIIDVGNVGSYPDSELSRYVCALQVERFAGWAHQTISVLENTEVSYKRWVGTSTGNVSPWSEIHIGSIDGRNIKADTVTRTKIEDGAISSVKLLDRAVIRSKLADRFMYGGRIENDEPMESVHKDGTYIVNANNIGTYPNASLASGNCTINIEAYAAGWVYQTISPIQQPENRFIRWVGVNSGTVSDWVKIVTGNITTELIEDGSITPEKLSENIDLGRKKPLKIFMVGNSFALDACDYLHHMCADLNINITIGVTYLANADLQVHHENFQSEESVYNYHEYVSKDGVASKNINNDLSLQDMLNKHDDWDIITFQQRSTVSDDYSSYQPYLNDLKVGILNYVPNNPEIGMMQTWANSTSRRADQIEMYDGIVSAYESAIADGDIGIFIPAGTAIQSARTNDIMNQEDDELTRDGYHLSELGKYVAGLTMFESLFSGYFKSDIFSEVRYKPDGVTDYQIYKAKLSAKNAVLSPMKFIEL